MTFNEWYEKTYVDDADGHLMKMDMERAWDASKKEEREACAKIADKYFRHMVSRVIAEEIRSLMPEDCKHLEIEEVK